MSGTARRDSSTRRGQRDARRSAGAFSRAWLLVGISFAGGASASAQHPGRPSSRPAAMGLAIRPMTTVEADGAGYFADPQPVRRAPSNGDRVQLVSGTTPAVMACADSIKAGCFSWRRVTIDAAPLREQIAAAGATLTNFQNLDIFQDDGGGWQAVVTIGVHSADHPKHWTVMAHARATAPAPPGGAPPSWSADAVIGGSFSRPLPGNYDGKYVEDGGRLYLLYVKNFAPAPELRNGIVLQAMRSFTEPSGEEPVVLLTPGDRFGPLASEFYGRTAAKLVEAPYLSRINGKYALVYSTGAYLTPGYKAAVAWSDHLLPPAGKRYRKVLAEEAGAPRGARGRPEVRYLLQSQWPQRPNYTGAQVIGPGVAAAVEGSDGAWWLYFAGFAPDDRPTGPTGMIEGSHRRPYFLRLKAAVPPDRPVAEVSDAELSTWLQPD